MTRHAKVIQLLLLLLVTAWVSGCVGWGSAALPPRLNSTERARLKNKHLALTVGVERHRYPAYSESLRKALQRTKLFDRVDDLDKFSTPPSLVARVDRHIYGSTVIPLWSLVTFGIVPTSAQETAGESFSLSPSNRPERCVFIEYSYRGRTTLGWVALLDIFHPNRTVIPFDPEHGSRFRSRLSLAILDHADELQE